MENVTELKQKSPAADPAAVRAAELQARIDAGASIYAEQLLRSKIGNSGVIDLNVPEIFVSAHLLKIQFEALMGVMVKFGFPVEPLLTALAEGIEKGVSDLVRGSLLMPNAGATPPPGGIKQL